MSKQLHLTAADQAQLASAIQILLSPLDYPEVDLWRARVNRAVRELVGGDQAGFLLPIEGAPFLLSDELDPAVSARYADLAPPPPAGVSPWHRVVELGVWNADRLYDPTPEVWY